MAGRIAGLKANSKYNFDLACFLIDRPRLRSLIGLSSWWTVDVGGGISCVTRNADPGPRAGFVVVNRLVCWSGSPGSGTRSASSSQDTNEPAPAQFRERQQGCACLGQATDSDESVVRMWSEQWSRQVRDLRRNEKPADVCGSKAPVPAPISGQGPGTSNRTRTRCPVFPVRSLGVNSRPKMHDRTFRASDRRRDSEPVNRQTAQAFLSLKPDTASGIIDCNVAHRSGT